jgi:hypothetical protein
MQKLPGRSAHLMPIAVKDSLYFETESPSSRFLLSYPRTDCFTAPASGGLRTPLNYCFIYLNNRGRQFINKVVKYIYYGNAQSFGISPARRIGR